MADKSVPGNYDQFVVVAEDSWKLFGEQITETETSNFLRYSTKMTDSVPGNYDKFVVIAEDNWKLYGKTVIKPCEHVHADDKPTYRTRVGYALSPRTPHEKIVELLDAQYSTTKFTVSFADFEWNCEFIDRQTITLKCNAEVHLELVLFDDKWKTLIGFPTRVQICPAKDWSFSLPRRRECVIMTIRVLKDRSLLPDFTSANVQIGHLKSNCRLWVGGQVFHVYKEMLCMYSPVFDRMFNGNFQEANKDDVKLDTETADPAVFHDFLMFTTFPSGDCQVLPNRNNVAGLLQLAVFYQVDLLKKKCEYFLENRHEMPILERIRATKKTGLEKLQKRLLAKFNTRDALEKIFLDYIDKE